MYTDRCVFLALLAGSSGSFACVVSGNSDGDGVRLRGGTRIRWAGIDAPEVSSCRVGGKCTQGNGQASKSALARLIAGGTMSCNAVGRSYDRTVAFCSTGVLDLSCSQVTRGYAMRRYANKERVCRRWLTKVGDQRVRRCSPSSRHRNAGG